MSLINRQPKKTRPASYFAKLSGLSVKTIKRIAEQQGWKSIHYSDAPNAPTFYFEAEVNRYFAERQNV